jgi:hypothetical protein
MLAAMLGLELVTHAACHAILIVDPAAFDPTFQQKVLDALDKIEQQSDAESRRILAELRNSPRTHRLRWARSIFKTGTLPDSWGAAGGGIGSGTQISWYPESNHLSSCDGLRADPVSVLVHELNHAYRMDRGIARPRNVVDRTGPDGPIPAEDVEVVRATNAHRRTQGLTPRGCYGERRLPLPLIGPCGEEIDCPRCKTCLVGACTTCQAPTTCNVEGRCSECGNGVIENGEECDGAAPHGACSAQGCRSNCTIDCGTCRGCVNGTCADITPPDLEARWAILHLRHTSTGGGCICGPTDCACAVGASIGVQYYSCNSMAYPNFIDDCVQGSTSGTGNAPFGCDVPECDPFRILELEWDTLRSCPLDNCSGPKQKCLPSDAPEDSPPLGTCFDLREPKEEAAGCCAPPPSGCTP